MAVIGEQCSEARFWWDEGFHLVAEMPEGCFAPASVNQMIEDLPRWAEDVAKAFERTRKRSCDRPLPCPDHPKAKQKGKKKTCPEVLVNSTESPLKSGDGHDRFDSAMSEIARAVAVPSGKGDRNAEPHPWFPGYGQEASGNYFDKLAEAAADAKVATADLKWSLYGIATEPITKVVDKGYLFFPEPTKRYATGIAKWEQDKSAVTTWCFLLALRGALLLRGGLRRARWRRSGYPAFPFVFEGGGVAEIHLPTWSKEHPRTLEEMLRQVRQFHVPLSQGSFAANAGEFRAAVQRRGPAVGFDTFHRFVIEARRPGQQQRMPQAIPRGLTRVSEFRNGVNLRGMIAPLGESGWFDQFVLKPANQKDTGPKFALDRRQVVEEAINRAVDEPTLGAYIALLESIWDLSREILMPGKLGRIFEKHGQTPRPAPPLPAMLWERSLAEGLAAGAEWRLARALGSILGIQTGGHMVGPILEQLLPVQYRWDRSTWTVPENATTPSVWSGRMLLGDFQALFWRRWLISDGLPRLPFAGARGAPVDDVLRLLRGELDVAEIHRLTPLFALLGWQEADSEVLNGAVRPRLPLSPAYAVLRLWIELGVAPTGASRPPRDGEVPRLISLGSGPQIEIAVGRALGRLRVQGLPWHEQPPPMGKAVVKAQPRVTASEAQLMALAVLVPVSHTDTLALSRRLLVTVIEKEISA
jgi:CRISPR-associated protein Csx17